MDCEARHGDARALSHRSGADRHPPHRARRTAPTPRTVTARSSSTQVARDGVTTYLDTRPDPAVVRFSPARFRRRSNARYGGVVGTSFRTFPSYPQRFIERLAEQPPCESRRCATSMSSRWQVAQQPARYTEDDLHVRQFTARDVAAPGAQGTVQSGVAAFRRGQVRPARVAPRFALNPTPVDPARPVRRAQPLDAHHAGRTRRVDELVAAERDPHVRRRRRGRREEHEVARLRSSARIDGRPAPNCIADFTRQRHADCANTYCVKPLQSKPRADRCRRCGTGCRAAASAVLGDRRYAGVCGRMAPRGIGGGRVAPAVGAAAPASGTASERRPRRCAGAASSSDRAIDPERSSSGSAARTSCRVSVSAQRSDSTPLNDAFQDVYGVSVLTPRQGSGKIQHAGRERACSIHGTDASPERVVRAPQDRPLAEGGHALVPGQG